VLVQNQKFVRDICSDSDNPTRFFSEKQQMVAGFQTFQDKPFPPSGITHHTSIGDEDQVQVLTA